MAALKGKVAIVTGSSRGIGRAIAERLAKDGASVVVNFTQNTDQAKEVVTTIEADGGRALAVQADVSRLAGIRRLFETALNHFGRLDIAVHSAALFVPRSLSEVPEEEFDTTFSLNAKGTFFCLQEAARRVPDGGRIIYISSCGTAMILPGCATYVGSKAAGEQFVKILAKELGPRRITVNSVSPGFTDTDMLPKDPAWRAWGAGLSAFGRLGNPPEVAEVVAFLASEQAGWITGANIQACGGVVMA
jgi:3-oxoacyl-[acyl-carrier protein] reductase